MDLTKTDCWNIQRHYLNFARNRAVLKKAENAKRQIPTVEIYPHKPVISKESERMAKELNNWLESHNIPHHEMLLYRGRECQDKITRTREQLSGRETQECTFKPDLHYTKEFNN